MKALDRKLLRDLSRLRGQVITIALVVACGIASYVTMQSAYASLLAARDRDYAAQRFGDVFAHLKRAPEAVANRIQEIPGVLTVETRLVEPVSLPLVGLDSPASGRIVTLPSSGEPMLGALAIRSGRMFEPRRTDEAVVLEAFASANHLEPGASIPVVINGVERTVHVVGIALSPEYVFATPGSADALGTDPKKFGVLWMDRAVIAPAFQMDGAFDDLAIRLERGASEKDVIEAVDALIGRYGGLGAVGRSHQPSHFFVSSELSQLESYATVAPALFLAVAAFLVNIVLSRLVHLQRPQIATLKALGYSKAEIGFHYLELVLVIVAMGAAVGVGLGVWLGRGMLDLYRESFHFTAFNFVIDFRIIATSVLVSFASAFVGAFTTVMRVARLPAAEAMQPEAPPRYRASLVERLGIGKLFEGSGRMVLREMTRRPLRLMLSCLGIALGIAIVLVGSFLPGAIDGIMVLEFDVGERQDLTVGFIEPVSAEAERELAHLPGVIAAESTRSVPVRIRVGQHSRDIAVTGHPPNPDLRRIAEWPRRVVDVPDDGVVLTTSLARTLGAGVGDVVTLELLEGDRSTKHVQITGLANEMFGMNAHMSMRSLRAMMGEQDAISSVGLSIDPAFEDAIEARLRDMPKVAGVSRRLDTLRQFRTQSAESMTTTSLILTLFGCTIAIGIVYNNARVALSLRGRDLASLRVLGFTRGEISAVLLGELGVQVLLAIVPGLALGKALAVFMMGTVDQELYRIPVIVTGGAYAFAVAVTVIAALLSALLVRRKLDQLDLVGVLKARE